MLGPAVAESNQLERASVDPSCHTIIFSPSTSILTVLTSAASLSISWDVSRLLAEDS